MRERIKELAKQLLGSMEVEEIATKLYEETEDKEGCNLTDFILFVKEAVSEEAQKNA